LECVQLLLLCDTQVRPKEWKLSTVACVSDKNLASKNRSWGNRAVPAGKIEPPARV
jgi:hypothetical protein